MTCQDQLMSLLHRFYEEQVNSEVKLEMSGLEGEFRDSGYLTDNLDFLQFLTPSLDRL